MNSQKDLELLALILGKEKTVNNNPYLMQVTEMQKKPTMKPEVQ